MCVGGGRGKLLGRKKSTTICHIRLCAGLSVVLACVPQQRPLGALHLSA